jgi:hypothetical protein
MLESYGKCLEVIIFINKRGENCMQLFRDKLTPVLDSSYSIESNIYTLCKMTLVDIRISGYWYNY